MLSQKPNYKNTFSYKRVVSSSRWISLLLATFGLAACGGGAPGPVVHTVLKSSLMYGQQARLIATGEFLNSAVKIESGNCTQPTFNVDSNVRGAVINCKVEQVGDFTLTLRDGGSGEVLYTSAFTVPLPQVAVQTNKGNFTIELHPEKVKATVDNFLQYTNTGYYSKTLFHRVIAGFVAQGGGFTTGLTAKDGKLAPIALETNRGLSNIRGSVAMARTADPNSATSEFYVNLVDNLFLDYQSASQPGYAVFGTVISGMDTLDTIAQVATSTVGLFANVPQTDVVIQSASQIK